MFESCLAKQERIKSFFEGCITDQTRYEKIIELGKLLPKLNPVYKTEENEVKGCQSLMYLRSYQKDNKVYFEAESNALISSGLAYLMIEAYSGETADTILKCPPNFLVDLKIAQSLSPNRANGLYSLFIRMKQDALKYAS